VSTRSSDPVVRAERREDDARVHEVVRQAFGGSTEAELVTRLRSAEPQLSLVAEVDQTVVGHIMFSPLTFESSAGSTGAQLSPLAVEPSHQRRGVGGMLVREGLRRCTSVGWTSVFLLGDPRYYARFGFELASTRGLTCDDELSEYLQCVELEPGALDGVSGFVRFHEAFAELA
jgi:putative acetyltransferase